MCIPYPRRDLLMSVWRLAPDTDRGKITDGQTPPVGDPALRLVVGQDGSADRARGGLPAGCSSARYRDVRLQARRGSSGTEWPPRSGHRAKRPWRSRPLARRTTARPAGSGQGRDVVADNAGTSLQHARSEHDYSIRASVPDCRGSLENSGNSSGAGMAPCMGLLVEPSAPQPATYTTAA
jgi:hypothetical protein